MLQWLSQFPPLGQALIGTLFTWGLTALGAAMVFFFKTINKRVLDGMLGFAIMMMLDVAWASRSIN